ncbi:M23 family metallopeptidase [Paenibacillus faecalis]|uniref:M23 family metallopeptidase n=1 Tax=Paenibacillus faecalis TaxID=2079532 RepID=UPI000D0FA534|nr:M23 family metallopeptidase [Paenibacillus faecalis]
MDIKTSVKHRREARIRELLNGNLSEKNKERNIEWNHERFNPFANAANKPVLRSNTLQDSDASDPEIERDPEKLWKQGYRRWYDDDMKPDIPPRNTSFIKGLMRRFMVSVLLFGAVWGIFLLDEPWAFRIQGFVIEGLSREMDFQAAQTWYEEHFGGPPSFIPIFGHSDQNSTKVNASAKLVPPLEGELMQSFAVDFQGIVVVPKGDSLFSHEIKSVDTGRVLDVKKHEDSSITVTIQHTGERTAQYSGLSTTDLKVNDWVQSGEVIGILPSTGSDGEQPALYFRLKEGDRSVDPAEVISFD